MQMPIGTSTIVRQGDVFVHVELVVHFDHRAKIFIKDVELQENRK